MQGVRYQNHKELVFQRHNRSNSDLIKVATEEKLDGSSNSFHIKLPMGKAEALSNINNIQSSDSEAQISLEQEIHELKKRLQGQYVVRHALEKALGYSSSSIYPSKNSVMPKPTKELIKEIALLELEVIHLERYLLSMYRKAFNQQVSSITSTIVDDKVEQSMCKPSGLIQETASLHFSSTRKHPEDNLLPRMSVDDSVNEACTFGQQEKITYGSVHRSYSSLPQSSICSSRMPSSTKNFAGSLQPCHSQPFSFLRVVHAQYEQNNDSTVISLADFLGTSITDHVPETPDRISEDMVRCMGAVYCRLAESSSMRRGVSSSPTSSFSSISAFSPRYMRDIWSPASKRESTLNAWLQNPFQVEGLKELRGPYSRMVEIASFCRDKWMTSDVQDMMKNYKSLVRRLGSVDPTSMKKDEKLSFWINIHNVLIMHAFLDYGIPQSNIKRTSVLNKVLYIIGGRAINANMIQNAILGCRTNRSGQWHLVRTLLSPRMKFKAGDEWEGYAIEHPEPLLHFALCSGNHSDPALRIYTSKRVNQQLEAAKEEYIRAAIGIQKEKKILLPKLMDNFSKEASLSLQGVLDMVQRYLPETLQMVMQRCRQGKPHKSIQWVPYNFSFRYLLSRELAIHLIN